MININRNILEIASQGVSLYDDFVTLSERLLQLGERLDDAKEDFDYTIKKLKTGNGSLIRKIETLKNLGIKTKKTLPGELLAGEKDPSL